MSNGKLTTAEQCRGARGMLSWSQDKLAEAAHISRATIAYFEGGNAISHNNHVAIHAALAAAGIEFIPENGGGDGVRFREPRPKASTS